MHAIVVPGNIELLDPVTDEPIKETKPVSFKHFVLGTLMADSRWAKDLDMLESALKVRQAVRVLGNPGDKLLLEDEDFKKFKECAEKPSNGYTVWSQTAPMHWAPYMLPQLAPFLLAIRNGQRE